MAAWVVAFVVVFGLAVVPARAQAAEVSCARFPFAEAGESGSLGVFVSLGLRCRYLETSMLFGVRYASRTGSLNPFAVLTYSTTVAPHLRLMMIGSFRERVGDHEIHRMPDLWLRFDIPVMGWHFGLEAMAGHIHNLSLDVGTSRFGQRISLASPAWPILQGSAFGVGASMTWQQYGTGASHSFWQAWASWRTEFSAAVAFHLSYAVQDAVGTSPLAFDAVGRDQTLTPALHFRLTPEDVVSVAAVFGVIPEFTPREYVLSWSRLGWWSLSATWRQSDGRILLGASSAF